MLGIELRRTHGRFEIETQPFLDAVHAGALRQIEEEHQIEHNGRGEHGIATKEVDLDLHGVVQPSEDIDIVPAFLIVVTRRVIVAAYLVASVAVELWVEFGLEN